MTNAVFTPLICGVCGREMGKKPGVQVIPNLVCNDPICSLQSPAGPHAARDAAIVAVALDGTSASSIAAAAGLTRQRVYQIVDKWKQGL